MNMDFRSPIETSLAIAATTKWFGTLISRAEKGILDMGLIIEKKEIWKYEVGGVEPVLTIRRPNSRFSIKLFFGNTLMEFLSLDRDDRPLRFDIRITDDVQAEKKLNDLVKSRLVIADILATSSSPEEVREKIGKVGKDFAKLRMWEMLDATKQKRKKG